MKCFYLLMSFAAAMPAFAAHLAYVTNVPFTLNGETPDNGTVAVVDWQTQQPVTTVTVGKNPWYIAASPEGDYVYVSNTYDGTVSVIHTATNKVTRTLSLGSSGRLIVSPDNRFLYVQTGSGVSVVCTITYQVLGTFATGLVYDLKLSANGKFLYTLGEDNHYNAVISKLDIGTKQTVATVTSSETLGSSDLAMSSDGQTLYGVTYTAKNSQGQPVNFRLLSFSGSDLMAKQEISINISEFPTLRIAPNGRDILLGTSHPGLTVIDPVAKSQIAYTYLPIGGGQIGVTPDSKSIWVLGTFGGFDNNAYSIVSGSSYQVIGESFNPSSPAGVAFIP